VIFVDSNIPMYLIGASHPHKNDAERWLRSAISEGRRLVTDAEVFQEILHRYSAIRRLDAVSPAFEALLKVVDEVFAVTLQDTERAREILLAGAERISARDAIHIAIMEREGVTEIMTFDSGFDQVGQLQRLRGL
jgi:uncharacterized protein